MDIAKLETMLVFDEDHTTRGLVKDLILLGTHLELTAQENLARIEGNEIAFVPPT